MIPKFEKFLYPFLLFLKEGELTTSQMIEKISLYFELTEEDKQLCTKSGSVTQLRDRVGWSRQYLRRALFIEIPQHGVYRITQRGLDYLNTHTDLTIDDLLEYPEYAAYNTSHKKKSSSPVVLTHVEVSSELTPTEQLEQAFESISNDLAADLLSKVMEQTPSFFEHLVVDLLVKMGYGGAYSDAAQVTQLTNDEGIDGIIYEDKLGLDKIYLQAKRWTNPVGRPVIQQFAGALVGQNATKGVFITTSSYSKEARNYVAGLHQKIVLIDGSELAKYMIEYNVGVSVKKVYEVKRIDTDYFDE
ncbi:MAG: restriction endonuclease [Methanobrevibacter sp.]|nr:restriction endonuclease [Methanobrevibacter sp.]